MSRRANRAGLTAALAMCLSIAVIGCAGPDAAEKVILSPQIDGEWQQIAGNPDLGKYTSSRQEPVDFAVWQAADGTWQLWSCIRNTKCGGRTRLFYRWEGKNLTDANWQPIGIAMQADTNVGEQTGGLQAPYVIRIKDVYYMFYGDWNRICLATSVDGKHFERTKNERGEPDLFSGPYENTRDPIVLKSRGLYFCYYTGHVTGNSPQKHKCAVFCRTSSDLKKWSEPVKVSAGGSPAQGKEWDGGNAECPFVVEMQGRYYLFRNQKYGKNNLNTQYCSLNPFDFGVDDDSFMTGTLAVAAPEIIEHNGQYYIAALMPNLKGIRIAKLKWLPKKQE